MYEFDRVVPLNAYSDRRDSNTLDRTLMLDEMEETAQAIRQKRRGFGDVREEEVRGLEAAIARLRDELRVQEGRRPGDRMD